MLAGFPQSNSCATSLLSPQWKQSYHSLGKNLIAPYVLWQLPPAPRRLWYCQGPLAPRFCATPCTIPTGTEQTEARNNPKSTIFPAVLAISSRVPGTVRLHIFQVAEPIPHPGLWGQNQALGAAAESNPCDDSYTKVEIKPQLKLRGSVSKEENQKLPTSGKTCRLNPHNWISRLCVYGIYKRTMRDPAKENTLALADTDIRGKATAGGPD